MRKKINYRRKETDCGVEATLELIGGKWKGVIVYHLLEKKFRFSELQKVMPNITQRMLTKQLRELEDDGIVSRFVFAEVPPRVEYELTAKGQSLKNLIQTMKHWGDAHLSEFGPT